MANHDGDSISVVVNGCDFPVKNGFHRHAGC